MKLYGKELDDELEKRKKVREERMSRRSTLRNEARSRGIDPSEIIAYEKGEDICPHEEWHDIVGGFPIPKFILKACKKCGKIDNDSMEKVSNKNMERVYKAYNEMAENIAKEELGKK